MPVRNTTKKPPSLEAVFFCAFLPVGAFCACGRFFFIDFFEKITAFTKKDEKLPPPRRFLEKYGFFCAICSKKL